MTNSLILDDWAPSDLLARAAAEWPGDRAPWVEYATADQHKRTLGCRRTERGQIVSDWPAIPAACRELLARILVLDVGVLLCIAGRLVPDTLLWGAGLCEMRTGDYLGEHLDADRHPLTGLERRANGVLFLTGGCGGPLLLGDKAIMPKPGRLVLFATDEESWHSVPGPITAPRRSLAVYWWGQPRGAAKRPRAQFA